MKKLSLSWSKHLKTEEERKEFEEAVRHDTLVLSRLLDLIDEKTRNLDREEVSLSNYENPAWAYKQAHVNGIRKGLLEVRDLLAFLS